MILDGARWLRRAVHPDGLPIQLTFFVTSRCNARCSHCFYGERLNQPIERELTLDEIDRVARGLPRLLWVALGGGEPFLRPDLPDVAATFVRRSRPLHLTVVTNGIDPDRIEHATRAILDRRGKTRVNVAVSLDGLAETHDRERGVPGNFARARETLRRLCRLRDRTDGLGVTTLTTVHRRNASAMEALERWIDDEIRPDSRGINLVRGRPLDPTLRTDDVAAEREVLDAYRAAVERKRRALAAGRLPLQDFPLARLNAAKDRVVYREVERVARTGAWRAPCRAGRIGAVLHENGDVAACEILEGTIGNVRDHGLDFGRLWSSEEASRLRRTIDEGRCRCTWECAQTTNVLFGPRHWPALLREWLAGADGATPPANVSSNGSRASAPGAGARSRAVTVIVPCRDEEAVVRRKVRNTLALRYPDPSECEVLVVDDGSTDRTAAIVREEIEALGGDGADRSEGEQRPPALRLLRNAHEAGKAGAILTGLEASRGEVVLLTDADVLLERDALRRALAWFDDPSTGVVCGEQVLVNDRLHDDGSTPADALARPGGPILDPPSRREGPYDRFMRAVRRLESRVDSTFAVHGQMMLFRRDLALRPRGGIAADDVDLALQARRRGARIRYAEGARFWEECPRTFAAEARQKRRRGKAFAQVLWAHRDMLADPRFGAFGLASLPFQWALLLVQPIVLGLGLTLGAAAAWTWAPAPAALATASLGLVATASRAARSYLVLNGLMLAGIASLLSGEGVTDRWARDRDGGDVEETA